MKAFFQLGLLFIILFPTRLFSAGIWFNVLDYGAKNDSSVFATDGINAAIRAANKAGGGTVYIPAGKYICGPIELVSNLVLFIDAGAVLHFPVQDLPYEWGRHQGIECITPVPLIGGHDLENVTITGHGTITTSNTEWMNVRGRSPGSAAGPNWAKLLLSLEVKTPATKEEYERTAPELRPPFIRLMNSKYILIQGIHIVGSPMWPVHILYSENAVVRNVSVETYPGKHTGGIYIDSSKDIRISDCYIDTGDDGIVIKSGKDADGLRVNRPTENVSIVNCTIHRAHGGVVLGSEIAGGIRNVVASNITCDGTDIGIRIKSRRGRGGAIEDVRFDNWTMNNVGQAISVTSYYRMEGEKITAEEPVTIRTPKFRNIAISNITINHARVAMNVEGLPEMPINGLRVSDLIAASKIGIKAAYTSALELHHVQINPEGGPALLLRDSKDAELDGFSTLTPASGMPVIRLDRCAGTIVRNCRAFQGTGIFLSVGPGELKSIILESNALTQAKNAAEESETVYWLTTEPATEGE